MFGSVKNMSVLCLDLHITLLSMVERGRGASGLKWCRFQRVVYQRDICIRENPV